MTMEDYAETIWMNSEGGFEGQSDNCKKNMILNRNLRKKKGTHNNTSQITNALWLIAAQSTAFIRHFKPKLIPHRSIPCIFTKVFGITVKGILSATIWYNNFLNEVVECRSRGQKVMAGRGLKDREQKTKVEESKQNNLAKHLKPSLICTSISSSSLMKYVSQPDVRTHYELCAVIPTVSVTIMSSESMTELASILQQKWDHVFPVSSAFESELYMDRNVQGSVNFIARVLCKLTLFQFNKVVLEK
ncbi:hypothetical protein GQR58_029225 [Nymphon striatum]|nr:hypothetical protein GQR58_029225 [Nymphon striatum]